MTETLGEGAHEVLAKVKALIERSGNAEELAEEYDKWAKEHGYETPKIARKIPRPVAGLLMKHFSESAVNECKILDAACGTGLVGKSLRDLGFKGVLHGIDCNENVISEAREIGCYDELMIQLLKPGLTIKTPDGMKYNAVICVGGFEKDFLAADILVQLARLLEKGGILVFSIRESDDNAYLFKQLNEEINRLKENQLLEEICCAQTSQDMKSDGSQDSSSSTEQVPPVLHAFCMRKL